MKQYTYWVAAGAAILALVVVLIRIRRRKDPFPYEPRPLLTKNEQTLYEILLRIANREGLCLLVKMRLADIMAVKAGTRDYMEAFNKIKAKHTDFILCDPKTMEVLLGIELDDASHLKEDRIARDAFVDGAYEACGIPLLHVWNPISEEELAHAILSVI